MSEKNVEIVRRTVEAYVTGNDALALTTYDPRVRFDTTRLRPEGQVYVGVARVAEALRTWRDTYWEWAFNPEKFVDAGDHVLVAGVQSGVEKDSGMRVEQRFFSVVTLKDGRIIGQRHFVDEGEALVAAGLSE